MFRRILLEDSAAVFTVTAFITAVSIFTAILWRTLRMKRAQAQHFENLPFETETPAARKESQAS